MNRTKEVREQHGKSSRTLAAKLRMSEHAFLADESSDPRLSLIELVALECDVPISELVQDPPDGLTTGTAEKTELIQLWKVIDEIAKRSHTEGLRGLVRDAKSHMLNIMPQLRSVSGARAGGVRANCEPAAIEESVIPLPPEFEAYWMNETL